MSQEQVKSPLTSKTSYSSEKSETTMESDRPSRPLPPARHLMRGTSPTQPRNENMYSDDVFGPGIVLEDTTPTPFYVTMSQYPNIVNATYKELRESNKEFSQSISPEMFAYYATSLLWIKIAHHRLSESTDTRTTEARVIKMTNNRHFSAPRPIFEYLRTFGDYTSTTGVDMKIKFPPIPANRGSKKSGYFWKEINQENHTLFENYPTLGVAGDALMTSLEETDPTTHYPSVGITSSIGTHISTNIPWYQPVDRNKSVINDDTRKALAKCGVSHNHFRETIAKTRINIPLIDHISKTLRKTMPTHMVAINFPAIGTNGSQIQEIQIFSHPTASTTKCEEGFLIAKSHTLQTPTQVGVAAYMMLQLHKESASDSNCIQTAVNTWSSVIFSPTSKGVRDWHSTRNNILDMTTRVGRNVTISKPILGVRHTNEVTVRLMQKPPPLQ